MDKNFRQAIISYWANVLNLKDYVESLLPVVIEQDNIVIENMKNIVVDFLKKINVELTEKDIYTLLADIEALQEAELLAVPKDVDEANLYLSNLEEHVPKEIVLEIFESLKDLVPLIPAFKSKCDVLLKSALITLVGYFDVLIGDIFNIYYKSIPQTLSNEDKIGYIDLDKFSSVEEAKNYIIYEKVESQLRASIEERNQFFLKNFKIDIPKLIPFWDDFREVIQRRHLLVHNDGFINKQYLIKVGDNYIKQQFGETGIDIGYRLGVNSDYLFEAIQMFLITGLIISDLTWKKLFKDELQFQNGMLNDIIFQSLMIGDWNVSLYLCEYALSQPFYSQTFQLLFRINYWLSLKRLGRWDEIKEEIESFDHYAFNPLFSLGVFALKEDIEGVLKTLPNAINSDMISKKTLDEWPILEEIRDTDIYKETIKIYFPEV